MRALLLVLPFATGLLPRPDPAGAWAEAERDGSEVDAEPAIPEQTIDGEHFRVHAVGASAAIARAALATAEATWPYALELYGDPGEQELVVNLLPTAAEYQRMDRRLTGGNFADNLAFSSFRTRSAFIALQPESEPSTLAAIGLPNLTRHQVAHEAAHVVCYNALENHPYHPTWFSEGAAVWVAEEAMIARGWSPGLEHDPFTAKWILLVQSLVDEQRVPNLSVILQGSDDGLGLYERYAVHGLVFRFLCEETRPAEFAELWRRARALPGGRNYANDLWDVVDHVWGKERLRTEMTAAFFQWVQALEPRWDQTGRSLATNGRAWIQVAFPSERASAWFLDAPARPSWSLTGALELVAGRDFDGLEILVGRRDVGHLVIHTARNGHVSIARYRPSCTWPGPLEILAEERLLAAAAGRRLSFRLRVTPEQLAFTLDGVELRAATSLADRTGDWGLGARAGVAGVWHDVHVE